MLSEQEQASQLTGHLTLARTGTQHAQDAALDYIHHASPLRQTKGDS